MCLIDSCDSEEDLLMLTYEKLVDLGMAGDVYRFSEEIVYDVGGKRLESPTSYVCVSVSSVGMETSVFPLFIQDGYSESDVIEGVRESARLDFLPIVSDRFLDGEELLDMVVESNME